MREAHLRHISYTFSRNSATPGPGLTAEYPYFSGVEPSPADDAAQQGGLAAAGSSQEAVSARRKK